MESRLKFIQQAYIVFGDEGPKSLVSSLTSLGSSIFKNTEELQEQLIRKHIINTEIFFLACKDNNKSFPYFFQLLVKFPETLKFNKQLFLHRSTHEYNLLFLKATKSIPENILSSFCDYYHLASIEDAKALIGIGLESWFSQLDTNNIDAQQMFQRFNKIIGTMLDIKKFSQSNNKKTTIN